MCIYIKIKIKINLIINIYIHITNNINTEPNLNTNLINCNKLIDNKSTRYLIKDKIENQNKQNYNGTKTILICKRCRNVNLRRSFKNTLNKSNNKEPLALTYCYFSNASKTTSYWNIDVAGVCVCVCTRVYNVAWCHQRYSQELSSTLSFFCFDMI